MAQGELKGEKSPCGGWGRREQDCRTSEDDHSGWVRFVWESVIPEPAAFGEKSSVTNLPHVCLSLGSGVTDFLLFRWLPRRALPRPDLLVQIWGPEEEQQTSGWWGGTGRYRKGGPSATMPKGCQSSLHLNSPFTLKTFRVPFLG